MTAFPDTSFRFALYRQQDNSPVAVTHLQSLAAALPASGLLLYELRQSFRFQVWLHTQNLRKGITERQCEKALSDLQADLASRVLAMVAVDAADVQRLAKRLSAAHTKAHGHGALDVLRVAMALHLGAGDFLSFNANQRKLAAAGGLNVKPSAARCCSGKVPARTPAARKSFLHRQGHPPARWLERRFAELIGAASRRPSNPCFRATTCNSASASTCALTTFPLQPSDTVFILYSWGFGACLRRRREVAVMPA